MTAVRSGQTCYDWQHYIPLIERKPGALRNGAPFAEMPEPLAVAAVLLKHEGGDRIMAKVLAAVPKAGLEAVLVAVELVVESGDQRRAYPQRRGPTQGGRHHRTGGTSLQVRRHRWRIWPL